MKVQVTIGYKMDEEIKMPVVRTLDLCTTYNKVYDSLGDILPQLEKSELLLLMFLVTVPTEDNRITSGALIREQFIKHVEKATNNKLSYKDNTIQQAFTSLKKHGLLLATDKLGVFYLNPEFIFRGGEKERIRRNRIIEGKYLKDLS